MALFGMILVHFHQRMELPATGVEDLVGWFIWMGVETKAWATFAFLFGASFAILMRNAESRGRRVVPLFLRRMVALAVIGIVVQMLFGFFILVDYAIWGVALLVVRNWSTRALLVLALCSAVAGTAIGTLRSQILSARLGRAQAETVLKNERRISAERWDAINAAEKNAGFRDAVKARIAHFRSWYLRPRILIPDSNFVLFIFGLLAIRHGVFEDARRKRRVILAAMSFGLASWATAWFVVPRLPFATTGWGIISDQWLALTYIGAITLLLAYRPEWKRRLKAFGITGRMALTNYVFQAAVISLLATGYGVALRIRPYYVIPASFGLFAIQVALSSLWLAHHRYGPLERMWRWVTYAEWLRTQNSRPSTIDN